MARSSVHGRGAPSGGPVRPARGTGDGPARNTGGGARHGGRSGHRAGRRHRVLRWSATALSVLILGTAGAGYLYYRHLNGNIAKGERSSGDSKAHRAEPNAAGQRPLNILLIGSDSRASDANVALGGGRDHRDGPPLGDVQMLIHLSADRRSASVVSVPRDTRVDIPRCTDPGTGRAYPAANDIINATLGRGGAGCTLATWENLSDVYIDHWMTIDFAGVVRMADAIGGVEVCVNQNVWDRPTARQRGGSGLRLTAGAHKVKGEQALQWLRTRHAWGSDQLRARAQHMYMNSMIRTLKDQNVFTDTGRLMKLAEAATKSLTVSREIGTVKALYDLAAQLRTVPTDRITMTTLPTVQDPQDVNHLLPEETGAERMWAMLRDDVPFDGRGNRGGGADGGTTGSRAPDTAGTTGGAAGGTADPGATDGAGGAAAGGSAPPDPGGASSAADAALGVLVRNATGSASLGPATGRAGAVARALAERGFDRAVTDNSAAGAEPGTSVLLPENGPRDATLRVARALGIPAAAVRESAEVSGVTVVVGADWRAGDTYPEQRTPQAGDLPENSDALSGSETGKCMDVYEPYRW
ncbi:LCP family protein [Streptomyces sp. SHP 1-2]|uniref:LCP family protein n=1 Tax=Streptomyces sp. SHP 1-2 TaxID=2769489 RepID=UPI002238480B|nr:LCP family protein [Streptomyces sp. SHP 1-2]MCW5253850.1 LCP family protein [Streptomyces sp. SHP 1-2]